MKKEKFKKVVFDLMIKNRRKSGRYQYTVPSPQTYPYQWLWDSCFHAIILSHLSIEDAKKELLSLVTHQYKDGFMPHMIYWDKARSSDFPVVEWGREDTSTITQPPMLAYAVWQIYKKDQDKEFLEKIYINLRAFYQYLLEERGGEDHLIGIINPDESGEDNSPRFDKPLGLSPTASLEENFGKRLELIGKNKSCNFEAKTCMQNFFWVKDVPFNAIMAENLKILSEIADVLKRSEDKKYFLKQSRLIVEAMEKWMLKDGIFHSVYNLENKIIKAKTWSVFAPLFAGICTKSQALNLVNNYLLDKKQFMAEFVVPTASLDDPSFNPDAPEIKGSAKVKPTDLSWRGPIWMATNWFVYKGLRRYGFKKEAALILKSSLSLLEKSGFREYYHPKTGEGMGARNFSWGGLVLDMG